MPDVGSTLGDPSIKITMDLGNGGQKFFAMLDKTEEKTKKIEENTDKIDKNLKKVNSGSGKQFLSDFEKGVIVVNQLAELIRKAIMLGSLMMKPLMEAGLFEKFKVTLRNLLGDVDKADQRFRELVEFAAKTPFDVPGVVEAGNRLQALGKYSLQTLRMLGDLAAASGKDVSQAIEAYTSLVTGRTGFAIKQFRAMLISTTDWTRETGKQVLKTGAGVKASITEMLEALPRIIEKKGFTNLMDAQSKTFLGKLANMKDAWQQLLAGIGDQSLEPVKKGIDGVISSIEMFRDNIGSITEAFKTFWDSIKWFVVPGILLKAFVSILAGIKALAIGFAATTVATGELRKGMSLFGSLMNRLGVMLRTHPMVAFSVIILGAVAAMKAFNKLNEENLDDSIKRNERIIEGYNSRQKALKSERSEIIKNVQLLQKLQEYEIGYKKQFDTKVAKGQQGVIAGEKSSGKDDYTIEENRIRLTQKVTAVTKKVTEEINNSKKANEDYIETEQTLKDVFYKNVRIIETATGKQYQLAYSQTGSNISASLLTDKLKSLNKELANNIALTRSVANSTLAMSIAIDKMNVEKSMRGIRDDVYDLLMSTKNIFMQWREQFVATFYSPEGPMGGTGFQELAAKIENNIRDAFKDVNTKEELEAVYVQVSKDVDTFSGKMGDLRVEGNFFTKVYGGYFDMNEILSPEKLTILKGMVSTRLLELRQSMDSEFTKIMEGEAISMRDKFENALKEALSEINTGTPEEIFRKKLEFLEDVKKKIRIGGFQIEYTKEVEYFEMELSRVHNALVPKFGDFTDSIQLEFDEEMAKISPFEKFRDVKVDKVKSDLDKLSTSLVPKIGAWADDIQAKFDAEVIKIKPFDKFSSFQVPVIDFFSVMTPEQIRSLNAGWTEINTDIENGQKELLDGAEKHATAMSKLLKEFSQRQSAIQATLDSDTIDAEKETGQKKLEMMTALINRYMAEEEKYGKDFNKRVMPHINELEYKGTISKMLKDWKQTGTDVEKVIAESIKKEMESFKLSSEYLKLTSDEKLKILSDYSKTWLELMKVGIAEGSEEEIKLLKSTMDERNDLVKKKNIDLANQRSLNWNRIFGIESIDVNKMESIVKDAFKKIFAQDLNVAELVNVKDLGLDKSISSERLDFSKAVNLEGIQEQGKSVEDLIATYDELYKVLVSGINDVDEREAMSLATLKSTTAQRLMAKTKELEAIKKGPTQAQLNELKGPKDVIDTEALTALEKAYSDAGANVQKEINSMLLLLKSYGIDTSAFLIDVEEKKWENIVGVASQAQQALVDLIQEATQYSVQQAQKEADAWVEAQNKKIDAEEEYLMNFARTRNQENKISEAAAAKREEVEKEAEAKVMEAKKKAWETEKAIKISNILMNMAEAASKITSQLGVFAAIGIGIALASGAAMLAIVTNQKFPGYKKGGYVGSDKKENEPAGIVHGKEFVVNARATKKNRKLLDKINEGEEIPEFKGGGIVKGEEASLIDTVDKTVNYIKSAFVKTKDSIDMVLNDMVFNMGAKNVALQKMAAPAINSTTINRNSNVTNIDNSALVKEVKELRRVMTYYAEHPIAPNLSIGKKDSRDITRIGIKEIRKTSL